VCSPLMPVNAKENVSKEGSTTTWELPDRMKERLRGLEGEIRDQQTWGRKRGRYGESEIDQKRIRRKSHRTLRGSICNQEESPGANPTARKRNNQRKRRLTEKRRREKPKHWRWENSRSCGNGGKPLNRPRKRMKGSTLCRRDVGAARRTQP